MLARIERGEADGIIAWHPDRLARNSVDGGQIIYQLDRGKLKDLKFANFTFENNPQGKLMLSVLLGFSKYYVDSLSENVKRGNRAKLERGWLPNAPPIGYRNDRDTKTIVPDAERFEIVRRLFSLALTGNYSLRQLCNQTQEWGLVTRPRKTIGGRPLSLSGMHRVLRNPFYAGLIVWRGHTYRGAHVPLISLQDRQRVLRLLGRYGKQAPQTRTFPFTGLIRCGGCGLMVTAETKVNRYGSTYTYYHCTRRRRDVVCRQASIQAATLDLQIRDFLRSITTSNQVHTWALAELERSHASTLEPNPGIVESLERAAIGAGNAIDNLTSLRLRDQIGEDEFARLRPNLQEEKYLADERLRAARAGPIEWFEPIKALLIFSNRALLWYTEGNESRKREILRSVGSNLVLTNKILSGEATKPFGKRTNIFRRSDLCTHLNDTRTKLEKEDKETTDALKRIAELTTKYLKEKDEPYSGLDSLAA